MRREHQAWLAGPLPEARWEPWGGGGGLGPAYGRGRGSADGVSYIGDLDVLAALVVAAQLKHQRPHMAAQLSLRHTAYDLCHPGGGGGAESQGGKKRGRRVGRCGQRTEVEQLQVEPPAPTHG